MCTRQEDKERGLESWHDGEQAARTEGVRKLSETLNEHCPVQEAGAPIECLRGKQKASETGRPCTSQSTEGMGSQQSERKG